VHPVEGDQQPHHRLYLMCDDLTKTVADLKKRGVEFAGEVADKGWGLVTMMRVPGADDIALYQPKHASPLKPTK
jgi:hypothetical protein